VGGQDNFAVLCTFDLDKIKPNLSNRVKGGMKGRRRRKKEGGRGGSGIACHINFKSCFYSGDCYGGRMTTKKGKRKKKGKEKKKEGQKAWDSHASRCLTLLRLGNWGKRRRGERAKCQRLIKLWL